MSGSDRPKPTAMSNTSRATRVVALLVLIPGIPLLLVSVATLVLFYLAPDRLGRVLARLPGQEVIQTALFFAPVTLFAVVILAVLYARDRPAMPPAAAPRAPAPMRATAWVLLITVPPLLAAGTAWAARFIAPGRFGAFLDPLPGTTYLHWAVSTAPPVLLAVVLITLVVHIAGRVRASAQTEDARGRLRAPWSGLSTALAKLAAGLVLLPALPLLLLSVAGLVLYHLQPELLTALADKLSRATVLRLGVLIVPVALLALIFLAGLTLVSVPRGASAPSVSEPPVQAQDARGREERQFVAVGVLVGGLMATIVVALGLVGAVVWLLLR